MVLLAAPIPNRYTEAANLIEQLPVLLADARTRLSLTVTAQSKQVGITAASLSKIGPNSTQATIVKSLRWLATH